MHEFLIADLDIGLRPGDDLNFIREPWLKVFEHRFGFGILAPVEDLDGLLEGAQNRRRHLPSWRFRWWQRWQRWQFG
jgi:hypothetical protein